MVIHGCSSQPGCSVVSLLLGMARAKPDSGCGEGWEVRAACALKLWPARSPAHCDRQAGGWRVPGRKTLPSSQLFTKNIPTLRNSPASGYSHPILQRRRLSLGEVK